MDNKSQQPNWDIFCKIVDNFGDIGVCWRLSKLLATEHQLNIRLFIDDFLIASKIIPNFDPNKATQTISGVLIQPWPTNATTMPDVVVENFSCALPQIYSEQIAKHNKSCIKSAQVTWINLEYLSAERWVEGCHTLPSTHPTLGYRRYFFYPGFSKQTGGLLREKTLLQARDHFTASPQTQQEFWDKHITAPKHHTFTASTKISIFSYPQADINTLITQLSKAPQKTSVFLPFNAETKSLEQLIETHKLNLESTKIIGNTSLYLLPFLSNDNFDQLLWSCDLNFVRGEDSWIRAIWAGKPFVWQPYIQSEDTHITKLSAFLAEYTFGNTPINLSIKKANLVWSNAEPIPSSNFWCEILSTLPEWQAHAAHYTKNLSKLPELSSQLITFTNKLKHVD